MTLFVDAAQIPVNFLAASLRAGGLGGNLSGLASRCRCRGKARNGRKVDRGVEVHWCERGKQGECLLVLESWHTTRRMDRVFFRKKKKSRCWRTSSPTKTRDAIPSQLLTEFCHSLVQTLMAWPRAMFSFILPHPFLTRP